MRDSETEDYGGNFRFSNTSLSMDSEEQPVESSLHIGYIMLFIQCDAVGGKQGISDSNAAVDRAEQWTRTDRLYDV